MRDRVRGWAVVLAAAVAGGCGGSTPPAPAPPDTGAERVARAFFDALLREDWAGAYDTLDADSRAAFPRDRFAQLGRDYRRALDFTPTDVSVAVSEAGDRASAVAIFRAGSGAEQRSYRDGTALRQTPGGWAVVLRKNFGKRAVAPPARVNRPGGA